MTDRKIEAWRLLLTGHALLVDRLARDMEERHGLALTRYEVLLLLYEAGGELRMHELASSLLLSRSATTRFVDRMVDEGLVERGTSEEDRRGTVVMLSRRGREVFAEAGPDHLDGIRRVFADHITDGEAEVIATALERVVAAAREG
jgi:DNA-binding MarR family transcriptional regulator